ncbi:YafY family transcriptional regulator [Ruminococcus sp. OA3]|uniref:helix-turn-helix transcriptional regulator n=1 Tax=Ruminococcus sp. OA3 TaxID=2914164 RepID=UPI001F070F07|nr:YafY family protein [Ruminococcus sp. OA3]MCH1981121.1 YafY family transcriptional regulator [Ruminococcus sp. OA3]
MQESRLFKILYYLLDRGKATATELAEQFEVSVRTIYRDIDVLSSAGIPVYAVQGKGGGISLLEGYVMDKTFISREEQQQLIMALQSLPAASQEIGGLLMKLGAMFQQNSPDWVQVDFSRWGSTKSDQKKFSLIKNAVLNRQCLSFHYFNSAGKGMHRKVKPARLLYKGNAWYLQAFCLLKDDYRTFKINRIDRIQLLDEYFSEALYPPHSEPQVRDLTYPLIRLRFDASAAYRVFDEFDMKDIEVQDSGDLIVSQCMPEDAWLYSYLLSFGGHVDILEPRRVQMRLAETAKEMYRKYSGSDLNLT